MKHLLLHLSVAIALSTGFPPALAGPESGEDKDSGPSVRPLDPETISQIQQISQMVLTARQQVQPDPDVEALRAATRRLRTAVEQESGLITLASGSLSEPDQASTHRETQAALSDLAQRCGELEAKSEQEDGAERPDDRGEHGQRIKLTGRLRELMAEVQSALELPIEEREDALRSIRDRLEIRSTPPYHEVEPQPTWVLQQNDPAFGK